MFPAVALTGLVVRVWQLNARQPIWWGDSHDYVAASNLPLGSMDFWAGTRPVALPLLLEAVGHDVKRMVYAQALVAAVSWAALAASVVTVLVSDRRRWVAMALITALSIAFPVVMWDQSVLSESLALSSLPLLCASAVQVARGPTAWRVGGFLGALAWWLATRDSHAAVALVAAVGLGIYLVFRRGELARPLVVLGIGTFALAMAATSTAAHGERYAFPLRNVFAVRVLPYPDRVAWFADRGMPQAEYFTARPTAQPGRPPIRYIGEDDPAFREWVDWVNRDGRRVFMRWMVTHPDYVLLEPWRDPERTFNNAEGHRHYYAPLELRTVPLVTGLTVPPRIVGVLVALVATAWAARRGRWRSLPFLVGVVAVLLAAVHALVSWHSDGMETARHLVTPVVQFHLGVLLMAIGSWIGQAAAVTDLKVSPEELSTPLLVP